MAHIAWILKEKLFWLMVLALMAIVILPLFIVWFVLYLPPELRLVATILIFVTWGVARGYKDWITGRRKEQEEEKPKEFHE